MPLIKKPKKPITRKKAKHASFRKNRPKAVIRLTVTRSMSRQKLNKFQQKYSHQREGNFKILPMRGDGNCLFRAFAYHTMGRQAKHQNLRETVVREICNNWDYFKDFVDDSDIYSYMDNMLTSGSYGGEAEIVAFTHIFACNVKIYLSSAPEMEPLCFGRHGTSCFLLYSGLTDNGHYDVLQPMSKSQYDVYDYRLSLLHLRNLIKEGRGRRRNYKRKRKNPIYV